MAVMISIPLLAALTRHSRAVLPMVAPSWSGKWAVRPVERTGNVGLDLKKNETVFERLGT